MKGIEPSLSAWEADVLPLNYTREVRLGRVPGGRRLRPCLIPARTTRATRSWRGCGRCVSRCRRRSRSRRGGGPPGGPARARCSRSSRAVRRNPRSLVFLPDPAERQALSEDGRFYVPRYHGPYGWLGLVLDDDDADWDEVAELVRDSYRQVAIKRQLKALGDDLMSSLGPRHQAGDRAGPPEARAVRAEPAPAVQHRRAAGPVVPGVQQPAVHAHRPRHPAGRPDDAGRAEGRRPVRPAPRRVRARFHAGDRHAAPTTSPAAWRGSPASAGSAC